MWDVQGRMGRERWAARSIDRLQGWLEDQRDRWALGVPIAMGVGVGTYFALPVEPPIWLGTMLAGVAAALGWAGRRNGWCLAFALAVMSIGAGIAAAQWRTQAVSAPVLARAVGPVAVEGTIARVEHRTNGVRVTLRAPRIDRVSPDRTPAAVRIRFAPALWPVARRGDLLPGARIATRARLLPPAPPNLPGGFDFARHAWFLGLGGVGFAVAEPDLLSTPPSDGLSMRWARVRHAAAVQLRTGAPDAHTGGLAAALLVGERGAVAPETVAAWRDAGLAHLLAISGLHMGLLAGFAFFLVRAGLALVPFIALRWPIKKVAAAVALLVGGIYLALTGAPVPTQRAFIMVGLAFLAVMLDRDPIGMRLVGIAAILVLLWQPESLVGPSFQMSFAAVVALVGFYEATRERWRSIGRGRSRLGRIGLYFLGVLVTTVIAGLATAPYAIAQFGRVADYGVVANMVAVPVTALWVMPWGLVALLSLPFGLAWLPLVPMGWGLDVVTWTAQTVAAWPGAVRVLPPAPGWAVVAITFGGLWLCVVRGRARAAGLVGVLAFPLALALDRPPDLLVDDAARQVMVRDGGGTLGALRPRARGNTLADWRARHLGAEVVALADLPMLRCDPLGCRSRDGALSLVFHPAAVAEDCHEAAVLVALVPVSARTRRLCAGVPIVDRFDLWRHGGHAIWLSEAGPPRLDTVAARRGHRPWAPVR